MREARAARLLSAVVARLNPLFWLIVAGAAFLRLYDVNWDQSTHIHPDERFLTMVGTGISLPHSLLQYFDPATSPLNPYNVAAFKPMLYGMLPITLNKIVAVLLGNDSYDAFTLQGRVLSGLCDLFLVVIVYHIARLLEHRGLPPQAKYWAAALYAVSVFPIQTAHFFTVDPFMNVFMVASLYFALRFFLLRGVGNIVLSGITVGLSMAAKETGIVAVPLDAYFIAAALLPGNADPIVLSRALYRMDGRQARDFILRGGGLLVLFAAVAYLTVRVSDPYYFASANPFDPRPAAQLLENLNLLRAMDTPSVVYNPAGSYPPGIQWLSKPPIIFALTNMAVFGTGIPLFVLAVLGAYVSWRRDWPLRIVLLWGGLLFLYESITFVKTMRYFIFLYPFLALFAGIGAYALLRSLPYTVKVTVVAAVLVWPLAFFSIYLHPLSRVTASEWMYANLPNHATVLCEEWDDCLPLGVPDPAGKTFNTVTIHSFYPDTPSKWQALDASLKAGDYLVLSSNRGWGSMPTVPQDFPRMTAFYHNLFAGKTDYRLVARFTSYPSLRYLGIPIDFPDQWAEEAFTVYDHPEVMIFEHIR